MRKHLFYTVLVSFLFISFNVLAQEPIWDRVNYETSSVFTGVVTVNGDIANVGDMVGVFVNGECRMVTRVIHVNDSSFVSAVIHVDSPNDVATIKYYQASTNTVYELDTTFNVISHGSIKRFPIQIKSEEVPNAVVEIQKQEIEVYPSPIKDVINLVSNKDIKNVTVFNSIGNTIASIPNVNSTSTIIESSQFSVGIYLVSIELLDGSVVTKKVVKK